ncbi:MAG: cytosine permease [Syntrophomonadaceae bacterium]|nr:cytosine permease [Syntrophomonadaceae bacterium]
MKYIEVHTINPIPSRERTSTWIDLAFIWGAASICLPAFILGGALLVNYSWNEALAINFWGNLLVALLIAAGGAYGISSGQPAVSMGRYVFGHGAGQWLPAICILIAMLGWYAVVTEFAGQALNSMLIQYSGNSYSMPAILVVGAITATTALGGYQRVKGLSFLAGLPLLLICIIIFIYLMDNAAAPQLLVFTLAFPPGAGINLIVGGSIAGAIVASDFSRYTRSHTHNLAGTFIGVFIPSFSLGLMGMLSYVITGDWNPLQIFNYLIWLSMPFILFSAWTTNDNLLYSSGLALSNILPGLTRWQNTLCCAIAGIAMALLGITGHLQTWLNILVVITGPLLGVCLAHQLAVKTAYKGKTNYVALLATSIGIIAACVVPEYLISSLGSILIAGIVYIIIVWVSKILISQV